MWLYRFWLLCDLFIPFIMIVVGRMTSKHCPKNINSLIGYRTTRSMKNMDTWKFAHEYCGKLWWKIGCIMIILSALIYILSCYFPFLQNGIIKAEINSARYRVI